MRIEQRYDHLNAEEYLYYRKSRQIEELEKSLESIDANKCLKISCDMKTLGLIYYDQKALNDEIKKVLNEKGWYEYVEYYYVTSDSNVAKEIANIKEQEEQKRIIQSYGLEPMLSNNQVDFIKDKIAVEIQFGKYFSVAYDLHVKHTFFYLRGDIEVGIEVIPTRRMMSCMDSGVAWFENEIMNVIREGRSNPPVPLLILGVEPDDIISMNPQDYSEEIYDILTHTDVVKLQDQIDKAKKIDIRAWERRIAKAEAKLEKKISEIEEKDKKYDLLKEKGIDENSYEEKRRIKKSERLFSQRNVLDEQLDLEKKSPPERLLRIEYLEKIIKGKQDESEGL